MVNKTFQRFWLTKVVTKIHLVYNQFGKPKMEGIKKLIRLLKMSQNNLRIQRHIKHKLETGKQYTN
jgi:hypothetical protein